MVNYEFKFQIQRVVQYAFSQQKVIKLRERDQPTKKSEHLYICPAWGLELLYFKQQTLFLHSSHIGLHTHWSTSQNERVSRSRKKFSTLYIIH